MTQHGDNIVIGCILPDVKLSELTDKEWRRLSTLLSAGVINSQNTCTFVDRLYLNLDRFTEDGDAVIKLTVTGLTDYRGINGGEYMCPVCNEWFPRLLIFKHGYSHIEQDKKWELYT